MGLPVMKRSRAAEQEDVSCPVTRFLREDGHSTSLSPSVCIFLSLQCTWDLEQIPWTTCIRSTRLLQLGRLLHQPEARPRKDGAVSARPRLTASCTSMVIIPLRWHGQAHDTCSEVFRTDCCDAVARSSPLLISEPGCPSAQFTSQFPDQGVQVRPDFCRIFGSSTPRMQRWPGNS